MPRGLVLNSSSLAINLLKTSNKLLEDKSHFDEVISHSHPISIGIFLKSYGYLSFYSFTRYENANLAEALSHYSPALAQLAERKKERIMKPMPGQGKDEMKIISFEEYSIGHYISLPKNLSFDQSNSCC